MWCFDPNALQIGGVERWDSKLPQGAYDILKGC